MTNPLPSDGKAKAMMMKRCFFELAGSLARKMIPDREGAGEERERGWEAKQGFRFKEFPSSALQA